MGFLVLIVLYMAYRLNRDEGIIVMLEQRITCIEKENINYNLEISEDEKENKL